MMMLSLLTSNLEISVSRLIRLMHVLHNEDSNIAIERVLRVALALRATPKIMQQSTLLSCPMMTSSWRRVQLATYSLTAFGSNLILLDVTTTLLHCGMTRLLKLWHVWDNFRRSLGGRKSMMATWSSIGRLRMVMVVLLYAKHFNLKIMNKHLKTNIRTDEQN